MTNITLTVKEGGTILCFARSLNEGQEWQELFPLTRARLTKSRSYRTGTRARRLAGLKALRLAYMLAGFDWELTP
jgi:hypothetical protein